ncbi:tyrosine- kinase receptor Tie-1-like isoform X2, partial [Paramuricea clavata]
LSFAINTDRALAFTIVDTSSVLLRFNHPSSSLNFRPLTVSSEMDLLSTFSISQVFISIFNSCKWDTNDFYRRPRTGTRCHGFLRVSGRGCDGTKKNPEIVKAPLEDYHAGVGSTVILQWTYCKTRESSITGIIISRKTTYYQATHQRYNITWIKKNGSITFIIMNISMSDAGHYTLVIRRVGYVDLEKRVNVVVRRAESPGHPKLLTRDLISITKTPISPSTKSLSDHGSSKEIPSTHYPSHTAKLNSMETIVTSVLATKRQKYGLSKTNSDLTASKKHTVKMITIYKLRRRRNKRSHIIHGSPTVGKNSQKTLESDCNCKIVQCSCCLNFSPKIYEHGISADHAHVKIAYTYIRKKCGNITSINTNIQLQERNLTIHHQRSEMTNGELDDSFSASSMSGFSYRDSLESHDASDEEPPSTITFGIAQSEAPGVSRDFISIITRDIKQDANCPLLPKRKNYELKRELIRDMEIVGQGAFGLVAKAVLSYKNGLCIVAVKMLKEFASNEDRRDLIAECTLMRRLDSHKNVVQLLGHVLQTEPIWVVTEYVAHGDLLGFLRKCRGIQDSVYHGVATYCGSSLTQHQLLNMAKDIACGMAHLAQNKIIHRDLAARNVLVDENTNCKITDFGMARDLWTIRFYLSIQYYHGRIPFKWTAIEAILYDKYTTMSDVWSYGIVLYEIVTIGDIIFVPCPNTRAIEGLFRDWNVPDVDVVYEDIASEMNNGLAFLTELYSVMLMCWAANPEDRPSFLGLSGIFGTILGNQSEYINMEEYKHHLYDTVERAHDAQLVQFEAKPNSASILIGQERKMEKWSPAKLL